MTSPQNTTSKKCWINILPPELHHHILGFVRDVEGPSIYWCSLVQKRWQDEALRLLYESLYLSEEEEANLILESGGLEKWPVKSLLGFSFDNHLFPKSLAFVARCSNTLECLGIKGYYRDLFTTTNFPALKELILYGVYFNNPLSDMKHDPLSIPLPVTLRQLRIYFPPSSLVIKQLCRSMLLGYESTGSRSLDLSLFGDGDGDDPEYDEDEKALLALKVLVPFIERLTLVNLRSTSSLLSLLNGSTLRHLSLKWIVDREFEFLVKSNVQHLESLTIDFRDREGYWGSTVKVLKDALLDGRLKGLKKLEFGSHGWSLAAIRWNDGPRQQLESFEGGKQFIALLDENGVKLVIRMIVLGSRGWKSYRVD